MPAIRVTITGFMHDTPDEFCWFTLEEVDGTSWTLYEKLPAICAKEWSLDMQFPALGIIECVVIGQSTDSKGLEFSTIRTEILGSAPVEHAKGEETFRIRSDDVLTDQEAQALIAF